MSKIRFEVCGADIEYDLHDLGRSERLRINGELIVDASGDVGAWRFNITSFGLTECSVLMADGTTTHQRIDALDRLYILGKKYSHRYWTH